METYSQAQKRRKKQNKKKRRVLPIILIILGAILLIIIGVLLFFYIKLKNMDRNAPPFIPTAIELPEVTAAPPDLVEIDDPDYVTTPKDDPNIPYYIVVPDDDSALTEDEERIFDSVPDPDDDPYDPDNWPFDPNELTPGNDGIHYVPQIDKDVLNILILGNDARADDRDHGRTDVMVIASYNRKARTVKMVSIIRDTYIYIPGRDKWNRINTAFRYGGVGLAVNTINVNFGTDIRYYMRVDFTTLPQLVNAVGGIDINLTKREVQWINRGFTSNKLPVRAGVHHLNGAQALRHARNRTVGNHVWARSQRHLDILKAIFDRAKKEPNPVSLMALMYRLVDKLDSNMGVENMVSLGVDMVFGGGLDIKGRSMPFEGTWKYAIERGMYVIKLDIPANRSKLLSYLYGK